jgi:hypothetical protein
MKRFLVILSLLISCFLIVVWEISNTEILPKEDNEWHQLKRKIALKLLNLKKDPYSNDHIPLSKEKIDIVILANEKDIQTLPFAIDAAKGLIMHPINKIYLICPESEKLRAIAEAKDCEFIEENKVIPTFANTKSLSEFSKQQYIKLNAETITDSEVKYYLVIDSDTIMLQTQVFLKNGKQVLNTLNGYVLERKHTVESLLKLGKYLNLDFDSHHMLFDKELLKSMKDRLEKLHGKSWQDALNEHDDTYMKNFSEYEMYANYILTYHSDKASVVHGKNAWMPADKALGIGWQRGFLSRRYKTVSFHHSMTTNNY